MTNNYIVNNGGGSGSNAIGTTQPTDTGFWMDNGVLTFWDGTDNKVSDFNEGQNTSLFGTDIGDQ